MADNHRLLELAKDGDRDARDKLVTDNMGLVVSVARRYVGRGQELDGLVPGMRSGLSELRCSGGHIEAES